MIRALSSGEDFEQAANVTGYAFGNGIEEHERRAENIAGRQRGSVIGWFEGEKLAAVLTLSEKEMYMWGGVKMRMAGVGGVASLPEFRHGGKAAALLKKAIHTAAASNMPLSMLSPFKYEFYRKFGWEYTFDYAEVSCDPAVFARHTGRGGLRMAEPGDMPAIKRLYGASARRYSFTSTRESGGEWDRFTREKHIGKTVLGSGRQYCFVREEGDGYVAFDPSNPEVFTEFAYDTAEALRGIAGLWGRHADTFCKLRFRAPFDPVFRMLADEPRALCVTKLPGNMVRVTDFEAFASLLPALGSGELAVELSDGIVEKNNGVFLLRFGGGKCAVSRGYDGGAPRLVLDEFEAARLATGNIGASRLLFDGFIRGEEKAAALWDANVPGTVPFLNMFF